MRVIDARSGEELVPGMTMTYPDGSGFTLLSVKPGLFTAYAKVNSNGVIQTVPLAVRWTHPRFFMQHVAFFPS